MSFPVDQDFTGAAVKYWMNDESGSNRKRDLSEEPKNDCNLNGMFNVITLNHADRPNEERPSERAGSRGLPVACTEAT